MKHRPLCLIALIVFPFSLTSVRAQNILYWSDLEMGTDRMAQALAALPITYSVTTATSDANFTTLISGGGFNMGILFIQGSAASGFTSPAALASFVGAGGRAIYAQWDGDNTFAAPFGATFTGNINNTTVSLLSAALLPGVSNPA